MASSTAISPSRLACGRQVMRQHRQFRVLPFAAQSAARLQADLFVVQEGDRAHAVPLHFEEPFVAARHAVGDGRLHRLDGRRHSAELRALYGPRSNFTFFCAGRRFGRRGRGGLHGALRRPAALPDAVGGARGLALASSAPAGFARSLPACGRRARCRRAPPRPSPRAANSSRFLISSHSLPLPRPFMRTRAKSPFSFSPCRRNLKSPRASLLLARRRRPAARTCRDPTASRCRRRSCPSGMLPSKLAVLDRMIFHMRRQALDGGIERRTLGHGPGLQHAVDFQPEIVVQARGIVALHTEIVGSGAWPSRRRRRAPASSRTGVSRRTLREA